MWTAPWLTLTTCTPSPGGRRSPRAATSYRWRTYTGLSGWARIRCSTSCCRLTGTRTPTPACGCRMTRCTRRTGPGSGRCQAPLSCCAHARRAAWRWCWPVRPARPSPVSCGPPSMPKTPSTTPRSPAMLSAPSPPRTWSRSRWRRRPYRPGRRCSSATRFWDVQASQKAGVPCIGLLSGGIGRQELADAGAAQIYADPGGLLAALPGSLLGRPAFPPQSGPPSYPVRGGLCVFRHGGWDQPDKPGAGTGGRHRRVGLAMHEKRDVAGVLAAEQSRRQVAGDPFGCQVASDRRRRPAEGTWRG